MRGPAGESIDVQARRREAGESLDQEPSSRARDRWRRPLFVAGATLFAAPLLVERILLLTRRAPIRTDETLYVIQALHWIGRLVKTSPDIHRTRGVPALIYPVARATDATWIYRVEIVVLSLALCGVVYLIGRRFLGRIASAWAALMFGLFGTTLLSSVRLLPDLPAALGVAVAFLFYWRRVVRGEPGEPLRGLWPVSLGLGCAFYFNIAFAAYAGVALALDFLIFRRRELFSRATIGALAVLGLLIGPYFIRVFMDHGSPFRTLAIGLGRGPTVVTPGYVEYTRFFWAGLGRFWGFAVILGMAFLSYAIVRGSPIRRRDAVLLGIWAAVPTLAAAFMFHAEPRYLVPSLAPVFLCLALPVESALRVIPRIARGNAARLGWAALLGVLAAAAVQFGAAQYGPVARAVDRTVREFPAIHETAALLGRRLASPPCLVYSRFPRELELHTGCISRYYKPTADRLLQESRGTSEATFYVWWSGLAGDPRQPLYLAGYLERYAVQSFAVASSGQYGTGYVYSFYEPDAG